MDKSEAPEPPVLSFEKLVEKANIGKEPAGTFNLVVTNFVQHFSTYETDKNTKSKFMAYGELKQFDDNGERLEQSSMRLRMVNELFTSQTATVVIERYEDSVRNHLTESYCIFGGSSGIGDEIRPIAVFILKSNIYDYIDKAFVMANPQIEFNLKFTKAIQRKEMSITFDQPPNSETCLTTNHFTLDSDIGLGLWYANSQLVEIRNLMNVV